MFWNWRHLPNCLSNPHKLVFENSFNSCKKNRKLCSMLFVVCASGLLPVVITNLFSNSEPAPEPSLKQC